MMDRSSLRTAAAASPGSQDGFSGAAKGSAAPSITGRSSQARSAGGQSKPLPGVHGRPRAGIWAAGIDPGQQLVAPPAAAAAQLDRLRHLARGAESMPSRSTQAAQGGSFPIG